MVNIKVCIDHRYFLEPLVVWMKWEFPFLPRIGESVSPWLWIEQNTFEEDRIYEKMSEEGRKSWNDWDGELTDWLYDLGISADVISDLAYFRRQADNSLFVQLYMHEDE